MRKIIRTFQILVAFLILIFLMTACNRLKIKQEESIIQESIVNLEQFCGNFKFKVIKESWDNLNPTRYDTSFYNGTIRKYITSDSKLDLYHEDDSKEDSTKKITIGFLDSTIITSIINSSGELMIKSGSHYHLEGKFIDSLSMNFTLSGLGGLGGGWNYYVIGIRN